MPKSEVILAVWKPGSAPIKPLVFLKGCVKGSVGAMLFVSSHRRIFVIPELGNTKIGEQYAPVLVPQQVVWFDISMNKLAPVGRIESRGHLIEDDGYIIDQQRTMAA